jgi:hypothetical protein
MEATRTVQPRGTWPPRRNWHFQTRAKAHGQDCFFLGLRQEEEEEEEEETIMIIIATVTSLRGLNIDIT